VFWIYYVFDANVSLSTKRSVSDFISTVSHSGAGTTYISENYFEVMFSFHWISVLLINVTFYTYLTNIIFSCDVDFNSFFGVLF